MSSGGAPLLGHVSLGPKDTIRAGLAFRRQRPFRHCEKIDYLLVSLVVVVLLHPMRPVSCSDACATLQDAHPSIYLGREHAEMCSGRRHVGAPCVRQEHAPAASRGGRALLALPLSPGALLLLKSSGMFVAKGRKKYFC